MDGFAYGRVAIPRLMHKRGCAFPQSNIATSERSRFQHGVHYECNASALLRVERERVAYYALTSNGVVFNYECIEYQHVILVFLRMDVVFHNALVPATVPYLISSTSSTSTLDRLFRKETASTELAYHAQNALTNEGHFLPSRTFVQCCLVDETTCGVLLIFAILL